MKVTLIIFLTVVVLFPYPTMAQDRSGISPQSSGLTIDLAVKLIQAGGLPERVVELIWQPPSSFDLSLQTIDNLRNAGIPPLVLDAILKAGRSAIQIRIQRYFTLVRIESYEPHSSGWY